MPSLAGRTRCPARQAGPTGSQLLHFLNRGLRSEHNPNQEPDRPGKSHQQSHCDPRLATILGIAPNPQQAQHHRTEKTDGGYDIKHGNNPLRLQSIIKSGGCLLIPLHCGAGILPAPSLALLCSYSFSAFLPAKEIDPNPKPYEFQHCQGRVGMLFYNGHTRGCGHRPSHVSYRCGQSPETRRASEPYHRYFAQRVMQHRDYPKQYTGRLPPSIWQLRTSTESPPLAYSLLHLFV